MKKDRISKCIQVILSILIVTFFILNCLMVHLFIKTVPINKTDFASFEEFQKAGAAGYMNMPEDATDQRFYLSYEGLNIKSMYSYKMENEEEYVRHMEHIKNYSCSDSAVSHPTWDWYETYEGTSQEKEQMEYLPFEKLVDDDINTYTILYHQPKGTGTVSQGILVNEETRTFVIYYYGTAR